MSSSREKKAKEQDQQQRQKAAAETDEKATAQDTQVKGDAPQGQKADVEQLSERVRDLEKEVADLQTRNLRSAADYQNLAKRSDVSAQAAREQQLISVVRSLLPVLDQFDQALELDAQKVSVDALMSGIRMVRDELNKAMQAHNIERVDAQVGEEFDANRHEALMQHPAEGVKSNHVSMQMQPGYAVAGKTVRPAKVAVAP